MVVSDYQRTILCTMEELLGYDLWISLLALGALLFGFRGSFFLDFLWVFAGCSSITSPAISHVERAQKGLCVVTASLNFIVKASVAML